MKALALSTISGSTAKICSCFGSNDSLMISSSLARDTRVARVVAAPSGPADDAEVLVADIFERLSIGLGEGVDCD